MEDNDEERADAVDQAFGLNYDVSQAFWALDDGIDFELEDGEGVDDDNKGRDDEGGGGWVCSFRPRRRRRVNDDDPF